MRCNQGGTTPGKPIMMDLHHIFNAAVIMLLYQMVFTSSHSSDASALRFARKAFEREAKTECLSNSSRTSGMGIASVPTGYASDCLSVLNDLTELVERIRPLRFKDQAGINDDDMEWMSLGGSETVGAGTGHIMSDEVLEANLAMPFDIEGLYSPLVYPGMPPESHTHGKELQMWMDGESMINAASDVWHVT